MIITSINIHKFRAFKKDSSFELGGKLTVIFGRNRTQKTTLLGIISQPFSYSSTSDTKYQTIDGYDFKSQFGEKFKLSPIYDKVKEHSWTLNLTRGYVTTNAFTVESIYRDKKKQTLRFWNAGSREKGSGYIQAPVYFLSLSRLYPIGESSSIKDYQISLSEEEINFFKTSYNLIFSINQKNYLESVSVGKASFKRVFSGVNSKDYAFSTNSAGECNVSRIILAVMSFMRLKRLNKSYKGGILLIDEIDATLHSVAQEKLIEFLDNAATENNLQIIFTTHSPLLIRKVYNLRIQEKNNLKKNSWKYENYVMLHLEEAFVDDKREISISTIKDSISLESAISEMNLKLYAYNKIHAYCEDEVAKNFLLFLFNKAFIKNNLDKLIDFYDINIGYTHLITLYEKKIPSFRTSLIFLDHDVIENDEKIKNKVNENNINYSETVLISPITVEKDLYKTLSVYNNFNEFLKIFGDKYKGISFDMMFRDYPISVPIKDNYKYKNWFKMIIGKDDLSLGIDINDLLYYWCKKNHGVISTFLLAVKKAYNFLATKHPCDPLLNEDFSDNIFN